MLRTPSFVAPRSGSKTRPHLVAAALLLVSTTAHGDPSSLAGSWRQSPLREDYTVREWNDACGPRPQSSTQGGTETVTVKPEGDELLFAGSRSFRTTQCTDPTPRDAHSAAADGRSFRTHCATPASDPRRAVLTTTITAQNERIDLSETGTYEWTVKDGRCLADVRRSRNWTLLSRATEPKPEPVVIAPKATAEKDPKPPAVDCSGPRGTAAKLLVQPSKKLLRAGEKFTLRATLADEAGCPVEGKVEYAAKQTDGALTVDAHGVVESPAGAKAGNYSVVVSAAGRETTMVVEVVAAEHYDALLAEEGLDAEGEKKASVSVSLPVGGGGEAKSDDPSRRRKMLFLSIVGGLALPLGILAIVLLKRKSRAEAAARALAERHESEVEQAQLRNAAKKSAYEQDLLAHEASVRHREEVAARKRAEREAANAQAPAAPPVAPAPEVRAKPARLTCPVCRTEYEAPMAHCPEDGTRLAPLGDPSPSLPFAPQTREAGLVCPLCKRGFEPGVQMCPTHLEMLVPRALIPPTPGTDSKDGSSSIKGKICPTCGDKFELGARFCGKDGSTLLIIN